MAYSAQSGHIEGDMQAAVAGSGEAVFCWHWSRPGAVADQAE